jgi:DNA invertase Pin-like site-specific DNA recombinase
MATSTRRAALYVRVSTGDRGQSVENQLAPLQEAAGRLGWTVVVSEFELSMIRDRVMAGLDRARSSGKRLGRPRMLDDKPMNDEEKVLAGRADANIPALT